MLCIVLKSFRRRIKLLLLLLLSLSERAPRHQSNAGVQRNNAEYDRQKKYTRNIRHSQMIWSEALRKTERNIAGVGGLAVTNIFKSGSILCSEATIKRVSKYLDVTPKSPWSTYPSKVK